MDSNFSIPAHQQSIDRVNLGTANSTLGSNVKVRFMDDLDREEQLLEAQFQALFAEGKAHPDKQRIIGNKLGRLLDKHKSFLAGGMIRSQCFEEGWSHLAYHFGMNLWSIRTRNTKSAYCDSGKVVNRLRDYLSNRVNDAEKKQRGYSGSGKLSDLSLDAPIGDDNGYSLLDLQKAAPENNDYDDLVKAVEEDVSGEFSGTKIPSQPHVNAQNSLQLHFEGYSWTDIAKQLSVTPATFNSFLRDKINPLISKSCGVLNFVDRDITGEMQATVMIDCPHVNAQNTLRLKLRGYRLENIARDLKVEKKLLKAFIDNECLPLLRRLWG
jgi:hypothetical protein